MKLASRRTSELVGLVLVILLLTAGTIIVASAQARVWVLPTAAVWTIVAALLAAHAAVRLLAPQADPVLLPLCAFLAVIGLIELTALSGPIAGNQRVWMLLGLGGLVLTLAVVKNPERLREFKYLAGVSGVILLLSPILFGAARGGSKLWLIIGGYSFQPAEPAKVLLTIFLAAYLSEKKEVLAAGDRRALGSTWPTARHFGPLLSMWAVSLAILVLERDLGSSLIFFSLFLIMLYAATGRLAYVFVGAALFLGGASVAYQIFPHVAARVDVWLKPLPADVGGSAYQVAQSLFAMASGGVGGVGLGSGMLGRAIAMPAVHTDFIFSALAEELGLAGAAAILLAYTLFVARGFSIAAGAKSDFLRLLAAGLAIVTGIQAVVIIGGVIKAIPLTGVTLPFISYGGSSLISSFLIVGLLLSVSRAEP